MYIIASHSPEVLQRWRASLQGDALILEASHLSAVCAALTRLQPVVALLDLQMPGVTNAGALAAVTRASPGTQLVACGEEVSDQQELALLRAGLRGYCSRTATAEHVRRVVQAVLGGELWFRRSLISLVVEELDRSTRTGSHTASLAVAEAIGRLTAREAEVARLVGAGASNKNIALRLRIAERTVKAHLTTVYRKLGVADRVNLALRIANVA